MTIKVLHVGLSSNYGGIEGVVHSWFKNKPTDIQFDFINDGNLPLAYSKEYEKGNCHIFNVTHRYTNCLKRFFELNKIVKDNKYDFIHFHIMDLDDGVPILIGNINKCKVIVHCHSSHGNEATIKEKILKLLTKIELIGSKYIRFSCGYDAGRKMYNNKTFFVIENGIELSKFKYSIESRKKIRKQYGIDDNIVLIGHIGHSCYEKNYPFIIDTFVKLANETNDYRLMIIGNLDEDEDVLNQVKYNNITDKVIFTGIVDNAYEYYSAMDEFYLPSINEGFPLVLVEAQANGLNCVISSSITKDAILSDNVFVTDFDIDNGIEKLKKASIPNISRSTIVVDAKYDVTNSSRKLFNYYKNNI